MRNTVFEDSMLKFQSSKIVFCKNFFFEILMTNFNLITLSTHLTAHLLTTTLFQITVKN